MVCRMFGARPLPEPTLSYCQLNSWDQTPVKFESKYKTFHSWKCIGKCRLRRAGQFFQGGDGLKKNVISKESTEQRLFGALRRSETFLTPHIWGTGEMSTEISAIYLGRWGNEHWKSRRIYVALGHDELKCKEHNVVRCLREDLVLLVPWMVSATAVMVWCRLDYESF